MGEFRVAMVDTIVLFGMKPNGGGSKAAALGGKKRKLPTVRILYCLFLLRKVLSLMLWWRRAFGQFLGGFLEAILTGMVR